MQAERGNGIGTQTFHDADQASLRLLVDVAELPALKEQSTILDRCSWQVRLFGFGHRCSIQLSAAGDPDSIDVRFWPEADDALEIAEQTDV